MNIWSNGCTIKSQKKQGRFQFLQSFFVYDLSYLNNFWYMYLCLSLLLLIVSIIYKFIISQFHAIVFCFFFFSLVVIHILPIEDSSSGSRKLFFFYFTYVCVAHSRYKILRRRVIWMTGQWINVKFACQTRPVLYQVLLKLMNAQEDLVVSNGNQ